jgi:hypothetical protein
LGTLSTVFGDPDGSSTNGLGAQFLGDYATAVASDPTGWFVWSDPHNETACPAASRQLFGNSDIFVSAVGF